MNPGRHEHEKLLIRSAHEPPFLHGFELHSFTSELFLQIWIKLQLFREHYYCKHAHKIIDCIWKNNFDWKQKTNLFHKNFLWIQVGMNRRNCWSDRHMSRHSGMGLNCTRSHLKKMYRFESSCNYFVNTLTANIHIKYLIVFEKIILIGEKTNLFHKNFLWIQVGMNRRNCWSDRHMSRHSGMGLNCTRSHLKKCTDLSQVATISWILLL